MAPGDLFTVAIEKLGDNPGQGIGFLDDGTMVVINKAEKMVGQEVQCEVQRQHHTANGRMIFAELSVKQYPMPSGPYKRSSA